MEWGWQFGGLEQNMKILGNLEQRVVERKGRRRQKERACYMTFPRASVEWRSLTWLGKNCRRK